MLVLSRSVNQQILIGSDILITVLDIRGDKVRLGVDAPPGVSIHRMEVAEDIQHGGEGGRVISAREEQK